MFTFMDTTNASKFTSSIPPLCGRCGGRTDGKVSAPSIKGFGALISCECPPVEAPTQAAGPVLDSAAIDHSLMVAALEHRNDIIRRAAWQVRAALRHRQSPTLFEMHSRMALKILGNLGAA